MTGRNLLGVNQCNEEFEPFLFWDCQYERMHANIMSHYLVENPTYPENVFQRRFRMPSAMFRQIVQDLEANFDYFKQELTL